MSSDEEFTQDWRQEFLAELCRRPTYMTEVRRDGKDNKVIQDLITKEFNKKWTQYAPKLKRSKFIRRMRDYAAAAWQTCEQMHLQMLDDDQPENEKQRLDPDHWYEINLTNAMLFANLTLDGLPQLVPGRLFSTRMPRNIVKDPQERMDFIKKCRKNDLRCICVLTETEEFEKYSGMEGLLDFYREECGLVVYNRAIPDFKIPTEGDLMNNIADMTFHLSQGRNCLVHCAGGSGRTGMVIAAVVKNLGLYDPVARIRRVKSTYVETFDQETFLQTMPKVIDSRIANDSPILAKAIAAEHLLQVFRTHGKSMDKSDIARDVTKSFDDMDEGDKLKEAYMLVFDLVDTDKSGTLDRNEVKEWLTMCGSEINIDPVVDALMKEGELTSEKFAAILSTYATDSIRDYGISGTIKSSH